jgi:leucyl-tRNA synthetase
LLFPFAPHIAEELNLLVSESLGKQIRKKIKPQSLQLEHWPEFDNKLIEDKTVEIIVQINGKVKGKLTVNFASAENVVKEEALKLEVVKQAMISETIKRVVFVPNRLINLVI